MKACRGCSYVQRASSGSRVTACSGCLLGSLLTVSRTIGTCSKRSCTRACQWPLGKLLHPRGQQALLAVHWLTVRTCGVDSFPGSTTSRSSRKAVEAKQVAQQDAERARFVVLKCRPGAAGYLAGQG